MLALFIPPTGLGEWVDVPSRTFAPDHDPVRGRAAIRTELLGFDDPSRRDVGEALTDSTMLLRRYALNDQQLNAFATELAQRKMYGPVLFLGTRTSFDSTNEGAVQLVDLDPGKLRRTDGLKARNRSDPRMIAAPDLSRERSFLHVRTVRSDPKKETDPLLAFDQVMQVVSEYVAATQCRLSNAQSGVLPDGSVYYTASAEHVDPACSETPSTHERTARHGIG